MPHELAHSDLRGRDRLLDRCRRARIGAPPVASAQTLPWYEQALIPTSSSSTGVKGISCPSTSDCVAVGYGPSGSGLIYTTTDSGASWNSQTSPADASYLQTGTGARRCRIRPQTGPSPAALNQWHPTRCRAPSATRPSPKAHTIPKSLSSEQCAGLLLDPGSVGRECRIARSLHDGPDKDSLGPGCDRHTGRCARAAPHHPVHPRRSRRPSPLAPDLTGETCQGPIDLSQWCDVRRMQLWQPVIQKAGSTTRESLLSSHRGVSGDHTGHPSDRGVHTPSVSSVGPARAPGYPLVLSSPGC
jgi:hypothetical protein